MSISAVVSGTEISSLLRGSGLTTSRIAYVANEIADLEQATSAIATRTLDNDAFRTALAARIDSDVAAGKLNESDGRTIKQALGLPLQRDTENGTEPTSSDSASPPPQTVRTSPDGTATGEAGKSEISRSETIAGGVRTVVILYDDGTSESEVSYTTEPDTPVVPFVASAYGQEDAETYLLTIAHGTFVDLHA